MLTPGQRGSLQAPVLSELITLSSSGTHASLCWPESSSLHHSENSSSYTFLYCQSLWMEPFLIMSWERGLLPAVDWQAKKKKKASLPCYLSLISASCTELVVQWGVGHRKAFVLPFFCSNNSFVELDCDKSWHLHCPGLGIFTTHNIRSKSRSFSLYPVFSTQQSLLCSQYCNEWQTWPQSLCVCARLHRHDLIRVPNLLDCLETKANNKKILMFQVSDTKWYLKVYFPVTPSLLSPFLTSVSYSL